MARPFDLSAIGAGLPVAQAIAALEAALTATGAGVAVVQAPPGTGKTTLVPPLVANVAARGSADDDARPARVVVTQPRRVAARAAARRLAALDRSELGSRVGFTVRGERMSGRETIVEFVTPGILLRRLLADPALDGTDAVILDEVHERALETDLALGMLAEVRQLRGDLTLVAMSATVDAPRFAALLADEGGGPAPVVAGPHRLHPLEVGWAPSSAPRLDERGVTRAFLDHIADVAAAEHRTALAAGGDLDALVFVPGAREVRHVAERLRGTGGGRIEVLELHGQADPASQDRAISGRGPGEPPRIVVSTDLAESSLTVPGVRLVVDSGLAREPRRDAGRGMSGLVTVSCSRASAEQRAGRAARQGPGRVVRCYDERAYAAAPAHATPEIAAADLTEAALLLACWVRRADAGSRSRTRRRPRRSATPSRPSRTSARSTATASRPSSGGRSRAFRRIRGWGARCSRAPGSSGRAVQRRWSHSSRGTSGLRRRPRALPRRAALRERSFRAGVARGGRTLRAARGPGNRVAPDCPAPSFADDAERAGFVVALAFPHFVARRVPGPDERYLFASGTRAALPAGSSLGGHEWLAVAEVARSQGREGAGTGAVIRAAAPLGGDAAEVAANHLLAEEVDARFADGRVVARRERRLGAIVLASTPVRPSPAEGRDAIARALAADGLG